MPCVAGEVPRAEGPGVVTTAVVSSAATEEGLLRLRAKYENAKARISALEDLMAASRRVNTQARKEFQVRTGKGRTRSGGSRPMRFTYCAGRVAIDEASWQ